jgi:hypothetical protein
MRGKTVATVSGTAVVSSLLTLITVGAIKAYRQLRAKQSYDEFCNMAEAFLPPIMKTAEDEDEDE